MNKGDRDEGGGLVGKLGVDAVEEGLDALIGGEKGSC